MGKEKGVGALELIVGLMVVDYGGVLVKDGKLSLSISLLWWVMVLVFFISSNPEFQGVEGVIDFVGILMAVGSLILDPFIIRFEMQLLPLFPGREFGKLSFLKW